MDNLMNYLDEMSRNGRALLIQEDGLAVGWMTYFLVRTLEKADRFHTRPMWSVLLDDPQGEVLYIDKLASSCWNRMVRVNIEEILLSRHPCIQWALWYRPTQGADRKVVTKIKGGVHAVHV